MFLIANALVVSALAAHAFGLRDLLIPTPLHDPLVGAKSADVHMVGPPKFGTLKEIVKFELSEGHVVEGMVVSVTGNRDERVVSGTLAEGGSFYLSWSNGTLAASVLLSDGSAAYELRPHNAEGRVYAVRKMRPSQTGREESPEPADPDGELSAAATERRRQAALQHTAQSSPDTTLLPHSPPNALPGPSFELTAADTNPILDVMFVFTPQAQQSVGGTESAMRALASMAVQMANDAYRNTGSPLRMRAVNVAASLNADYVEQGFEQELIRLRYNYDGYFDRDVQQRRAALGADAVVLFVADSSYCGLAYMWAAADTAFAVVCTLCPDSVAHEIGHTIGMDHDRVTVHNFDYKIFNFGYCWDTSATSCRRSVMAYAGCVTPNRRTNCPRALYFSSPLVVQGALGRTTGIATSDNARLLREQVTRAVGWVRTTTPGGLIFSVAPAYAVLGRCEAVTVTGWRIGKEGDPVTSVSLNGVPALRILSQTIDTVQVLADRSASAGVGDVVVSTSSGYTTTLPASFAYEPSGGNFTEDFESGEAGPLWQSTGTQEWTVQRFCDSLPCANSPRSGPAVGFGGSGDFARVMAYDESPVAAMFTTTFSTASALGCTESVQSISLYYHMWGPQDALCRGRLTVEVQNRAGQWTTVLTATAVQARQDDPWLPLRRRFSSPTSVLAVRITAVPYVGQYSCYRWSSVSIDHITIEKTTTCPDDNCGFVSAQPTIALTSAPTRAPSSQRPSSLAPTSRAPTELPTVTPTLPPVPAVEVVQFAFEQQLSGISAAQFLADDRATADVMGVAAAAMKVGANDVCCLEVTDAFAGQQHPLTAVRVRLTYRISLSVRRMLPPAGDTAFDGALSVEAQAAFNATTQRLMASIASGEFLVNLVAQTPIMAGVALMPVSCESFSDPTSFVYRLSGAPSSAPTVAAASTPGRKLVEWSAAAFVVLGVLLIVVIGVAYGLTWLCVRKAKKTGAPVLQTPPGVPTPVPAAGSYDQEQCVPAVAVVVTSPSGQQGLVDVRSALPQPLPCASASAAPRSCRPLVPVAAAGPLRCGASTASPNFRTGFTLSSPPVALQAVQPASTPRNYHPRDGLVGVVPSTVPHSASASCLQGPPVDSTQRLGRSQESSGGNPEEQNQHSMKRPASMPAVVVNFARPPPIVVAGLPRPASTSAAAWPSAPTGQLQRLQSSSRRNFAISMPPVSAQPGAPPRRLSDEHSAGATPPPLQRFGGPAPLPMRAGGGLMSDSIDLDHDAAPAPRASSRSLIAANFMLPPPVLIDAYRQAATPHSDMKLAPSRSPAKKLWRSSSGTVAAKSPRDRVESFRRSSLSLCMLSAGVVVASPRNANHFLKSPSQDAVAGALRALTPRASADASSFDWMEPAARALPGPESLDAFIRPEVFGDADAPVCRSTRIRGRPVSASPAQTTVQEAVSSIEAALELQRNRGELFGSADGRR